jgi:hypothetical protein
MPRPPYRALGVALRVFSVLFAIGGLFMIFGSRGLIIRVFLHPPEAEVSTFEGNGVIRQLWVMVDTMKDEHLSSQDRLNVKGTILKAAGISDYRREIEWNREHPSTHGESCNRLPNLAPRLRAVEDGRSRMGTEAPI